jgi:uncharacterized UPF0160 family protein
MARTKKTAIIANKSPVSKNKKSQKKRVRVSLPQELRSLRRAQLKEAASYTGGEFAHLVENTFFQR